MNTRTFCRTLPDKETPAEKTPELHDPGYLLRYHPEEHAEWMWLVAEATR